MEGRGGPFPRPGGPHLPHEAREARRGGEGTEVGVAEAVGRRVCGSPRRCGGRSAWGGARARGVSRQGRGVGGRVSTPVGDQAHWVGVPTRGPEGPGSSLAVRVRAGGAGSRAAPPPRLGRRGRTGSRKGGGKEPDLGRWRRPTRCW